MNESAEVSRAYAKVKTTIWSDEDFRALTKDAQRLYLLLLSQPDLSACGILPLRLKVWSRCAVDSTTDEIMNALAELDRGRFVIHDDETDEVLLRTFMHHDGVFSQPNMIKSAARSWGNVHSRTLREAIREGFPEGFRDGFGKGFPQGVIDASTEALREGFVEAMSLPFEDGFAPPKTEDLSPQTATRSPKKPRTALAIVGSFDEFWSAYPNKIDKQKCEKLYERALKTTTHETIMAGLCRWLPHFTANPGYIANPSTWLNNARWEADIPKPHKGKQAATADKSASTVTQWHQKRTQEQS